MSIFLWKAINFFGPTYGTGRHHAPFAYQMSVVIILTCIHHIYTKRDHLPGNILQIHGFSWLMYLMTFRHRSIWTIWTLHMINNTLAPSCIIWYLYYANFSNAFDHWFKLIFIRKVITCMDTLFWWAIKFFAPINGSYIMHCLISRCHW